MDGIHQGAQGIVIVHVLSSKEVAWLLWFVLAPAMRACLIGVVGKGSHAVNTINMTANFAPFGCQTVVHTWLMLLLLF